MNVRRSVVVGGALLTLVGLMSTPPAVVRSRSAEGEGADSAELRPMSPDGRPG